MNPLKYLGNFAVRALTASALMTVSQHVEMSITSRQGSDLPVRVFEKLTGRSVPVGVSQTIAGQVVQGMLAASALAMARLARRLDSASAIAFTALFLVSSNAIGARALRLSDMPWKWSKQDVATDALHKTTLAVAATVLARYPRRAAIAAGQTGSVEPDSAL
jgi:hypothetical protein